LANKFAGSKARPGLADRLRQLNTKFGLRAKRVFLVWSRFTGQERGEGDEKMLARVELLPTPKVSDLSAVTLNPYSGGKLPVGSIRLDEVSLTFTMDELTGKAVPGQQARRIPEAVDFFFEVQEDGRGDNPAEIQRYRLLGVPNRREGYVGWSILLERASEDPARSGASNYGVDDDQVIQ
jgi:hypothetical protein